MAPVLVSLPPFSPLAVLVKAVNVGESTQGNWSRDGVVACSLELGAIFSVWHRDLAKIVVSRGMQVPENAQMMGQQNQKQR